MSIALKVHPQTINRSISKISTNEDLPSPQDQQVCRVCKIPSELLPIDRKYKLIHPCSCPDPVHGKCLLSDLRHKAKKESLPHDKTLEMDCQVCGDGIRYKMIAHSSCRNGPELAQYGRSHKCGCLALLGTILLLIGLVIFIILQHQLSLLTDPMLQSALTIGLSVASGLVFLVILYVLLAEVLIKTDEEIKLVRNKIKQKNVQNDMEKHKRSSRKIEISNVD